jgi:peptide/nickel transport system substrate-binding protein
MEVQRMCKRNLGILVLVFAIVASFGFAGGGAEKEVAAPEEGPQYGGTITYSGLFPNIDVTSWDPVDWIAHTCYFLGVTYEKLMAADYSRGQTGTKEFTYTGRFLPHECLVTGPGLAESWQVPDPTTVILNIRRGVMWPAKPAIGLDEPRELTAEDIVFCFEQYEKSERVAQKHREKLETYTALDRYTVRITMAYPDSAWEYDVGWGKPLIFPREAYEAGLKDWKNCLGTGAYQVADYVAGSAVRFDKNPIYWQDDYPIGDKKYQIPFADHFVMPIIPDESARIAALRTGKLDVLRNVSWKYKDTLASTSPELKSRPWDAWGAIAVGMRMDTLPFTDIRVRRAMMMAIDQQEIIDKLYGGNGTLLNIPAPAVWTTIFTPIAELSPETQKCYGYYPQEAKALLAQAGYPNGFDTEWILENNPLELEIAELCVDWWEENLNVKCELKPMDAASVYAAIHTLTHTQMLSRSDHSPYPASCMDPYIEAGEGNYAVVRDPYIEETLAAASQEMNAEKATAMFKELNKYCVELAAYISIPEENVSIYWWPWIKNYEGEMSVGYLNGSLAFMYAWVDQNLKKEMGYK